MQVFAGTGRRLAALAAAGLVGAVLAGPARALEGLAPPVSAPAEAAPEAVVAEVVPVATAAEAAVATVAQAAVAAAPALIERTPAVARKELPAPVARVVEVAPNPLSVVKATAPTPPAADQAPAAAKLPPSPRPRAVAPSVSTVRPRALLGRKAAPVATRIAPARQTKRMQVRGSRAPAPASGAVKANLTASLASGSAQAAEPATGTRVAEPPADRLPFGGVALAAATSAGALVSGGADQPAAPLALFLLLSVLLLVVAPRSRGAPLSPGVLTPLERPG